MTISLLLSQWFSTRCPRAKKWPATLFHWPAAWSQNGPFWLATSFSLARGMLLKKSRWRRALFQKIAMTESPFIKKSRWRRALCSKNHNDGEPFSAKMTKSHFLKKCRAREGMLYLFWPAIKKGWEPLSFKISSLIKFFKPRLQKLINLNLHFPEINGVS